MKHCLLSVAAISFFALTPTFSAIGVPAAVGDFVCPPHTQYKRIELKEQGMFSESCRNDRGQRQGAYRFRRSPDGSVEVEGIYLDNEQDGATRSYNAEGELLYTTIFFKGVSTEVKFTRAGWAAVAALANEQLKEDGKAVTVSVSGSGGLLVEHTTSIPRPARQSAELSSRFRREFMPLTCGLLARNPQLKSVELLIRWRDGEVASFEKFGHGQCASQASPKREP